MGKNIIRKITVLVAAVVLIVTSLPLSMVKAADRWPTQRDNSRFIGIALRQNIPIEWTGMDAWWPQSNGYIIRDNNWSFQYASSISQLKPGDVILWYDDESELYVNHIGLIVDVASNNTSFVTAEGNVTNPDVPGIGVAFKTYTGMTSIISFK